MFQLVYFDHFLAGTATDSVCFDFILTTCAIQSGSELCRQRGSNQRGRSKTVKGELEEGSPLAQYGLYRSMQSGTSISCLPSDLRVCERVGPVTSGSGRINQREPERVGPVRSERAGSTRASGSGPD